MLSVLDDVLMGTPSGVVLRGFPKPKEATECFLHLPEFSRRVEARPKVNDNPNIVRIERMCSKFPQQCTSANWPAYYERFRRVAPARRLSKAF